LHSSQAVVNPEGSSLGQLPLPNGCGSSLKWRPADKNVPRLIPIEGETEAKIL